ncbi:cytochrome P450 [Coprinopsis marcescibilis]|uniref:Cytochrome P450 n=1 Tax=Coprinopsis marcescibilis TaxID=230819 RepID=A0A5C3KU53_COPMA|nr:cytochrome P450 [Coprinopsis marcescibilis]
MDTLWPLLAKHSTIAAVALCLALVGLIHKYRSRSLKSLLPPGPPGHPILGNAIPTAFAYRKFEEWTKQYGPVFALRQGFQTVVVIGRMQAAVEIMEKEGAALVDRPLSISAGETLSGGMRVLLTPAGERFKKMRRALHAHLQPKIVASYSPVLMSKARQHIIDLIEDPEQHQDHAKRYSASVVMALAYGRHPKSYHDPDVQAVNRCLTRLGNTLRPGVWRVDVYPFLRYVPGYLKELKDGHAEELALFKRQLNEVKKAIDGGEEVPQSFGKYLLERQAELELSDDETAYLAGSMFGAGSDTTASAISIGILAAACYPEAQRRVHEELDQVIGKGKAPTFSDQHMLPQTMAFVLETLRWRPVSAGGFAHKATKDIVWQNYVIPKGTAVIGNIWAIGRDPEYFPDPERFNPQRWLTADGKLKEDMKSYPFGFGRRICPGQHIAAASVFINTALVHWAFNIKADPKSPIDELAFTESANTHPLPFKVILEPRVASTREGIRDLIEDYGL